MMQTIVRNTSCFAFPDLRCEGKAVHPDFFNNSADMSEDYYLRQLQAYKDWAGDIVYKTMCSRPELLDKLK